MDAMCCQSIELSAFLSIGKSRNGPKTLWREARSRESNLKLSHQFILSSKFKLNVKL